MGRLCLLLLTTFGLAFAGEPVGNQDPARTPDAPAAADPGEGVPLFRTGTRLVQVDVVVQGKNAPIAGLTKDDFELTDNGKRQPISIFAVRSADKSPSTAAPLSAGVVTNRPAQSGPEPVTATVLLMDMLNMSEPEFARAQALKFIRRAPKNEHFAIYVLNGTLSVLQGFTEDRAALERALDKFWGQISAINSEIVSDLGGNAANAAILNSYERRAAITAEALESVARHLKGLPGRKKLLWMMSGLPLTATMENERNKITLSEYSNLSPPLFAAARVLNDANVAIYTIDPRGGDIYFGKGLLDEGIPSMVQLTQMTGGKALYGDNGIAEGLEEAVNDTDLTYTLGFYQAEGVVEDGEYHSISVKVLRTRKETETLTKDIKDIRYRRGYNAELPRKPLTDLQRKGTLNLWVQERLDATDISIQAAAAPAIKKPGYYDVEVAVDISNLQLEQKNGRWVGSFELAIVPDTLLKPKGLHQVMKLNLSQQNYLKMLGTGMTLVNQVKVVNDKGKPLAKKLHLVVMDGTSGKSGSVRIPIGQ